MYFCETSGVVSIRYNCKREAQYAQTCVCDSVKASERGDEGNVRKHNYLSWFYEWRKIYTCNNDRRGEKLKIQCV